MPGVAVELDRIGAERDQLIPQPTKPDDHIRVRFRRAVFNRLEGGRVGQVGNDDARSIRADVIAVHPQHIEALAQVGVGHLNEAAAIPIEQRCPAADSQHTKAVVETDWSGPAHIA